ncbi:hypothetical protein GCM10027057_11510 [Marisediminicola antarctica]
MDYVNTFIAVAPDNRAVRGVRPPARHGSSTEPTGPIATDPIATGPIATGPIPAGPIATGPTPTDRIPTGRIPSGRIPSGPIPSGPIPTGPIPAGPVPTVAALTYELITGHPYELTSGDVIFTVMALRRGIPDADRVAARAEFYAAPRACLRSSDLGKRYGWGIHADADGRLALYGVESHEYGRLLDGRDPFGACVTVTRAMRSSR